MNEENSYIPEEEQRRLAIEAAEDEQDLRVASQALDLLKKMKRVKAEAARGFQEQLTVPNYDANDGHPLTPEEQIQYIEQQGFTVPKFDIYDGHPLTPEERVAKAKEMYGG